MHRRKLRVGRRNARAAALLVATLPFGRDARAQSTPPDGAPAAPIIAPAQPTQQLTKPPVLERFVEAEYPTEARASGLEGRVLLEVDISVSGEVTRAMVIGPAGHGFDEAALAAVRQFRFTPAEVDGKPSPVRITYAYDFVLAAPAAETAREGPVNFSGTVLERGTRRPLVGAEVGLPDLRLSTITDNDGTFRFHDVPVGKQNVVVTAGGHDRLQTAETIAAGKETRVRYFVLRSFFSPYETVVRAEQPKKEVTQVSLSLQEVQRIPGTYGDALKVVQNLPGVARAPFNGGLIAIRGTSPQDSGIFLDGERLPILYHFGGLTAVYNSELLAAVDYLPGNFPAYYGDIIGGVVDVRSRDPKTDGFHGVVEVNVIDTDVVLEAPLGDKLSFAIAGRRSYIDLFLPLFLTSDSPSFTVAPVFDDAQLKLVWRPSPRHTLSLLALHSQDTLQLVTTSTPSRDPTVGRNFSDSTGFNQLRLRYTYDNGPVRWDTIALYGETHVDLQIGITRGLDVTVNPYGFRSTLEVAVNPAVVVAGGVDWLYQAGSLDAALPEPPREGEPRPGGPLNPILYTREHAWQSDLGLWAEVRLRPVPSLLIIPALRFDQFQWNLQPAAQWTVDPRLTVRWTVVPPVTVKAGIGLYSEAPSIAAGETDAVFGNPALKAKQSIQSTLGVEWNITRSLLFTFETFYNRLSGVIATSSATVERDGVPVPERLANTGQGRIWGFETFLRQALTERIFGWLSYSFSKSQRLDRPGDPWRPFDFDQTHVLTAIVSYKLGAGWELGGRFRYATGNPRTPIVGSIKDDNTDSFIPVFGATNSARLPSFVQLDVRVDKVWVFDTWSLDLYLDVQNVTDSRAVEGVTYNFNYSQAVYFVGLPIVPVLGIKAIF